MEAGSPSPISRSLSPSKGPEDVTVLVVSTSITAHVLNASQPVRGLVARGARVLWCLPKQRAVHARGCGAEPLPPLGCDPLREQPDRWVARSGPQGLTTVRAMYRDALAAPAGEQADELRSLLRHHRVDVLLSDTLMLGAAIAAQAEGIGWASLGDEPLQWPDADLPPFGTGLPPLAGPPGRHRNRNVRRATASLLFQPALELLNGHRWAHGLWPVADLLTAGVSRQAHLQGCAPGFEYPSARRPGFIHFVGALGPGPGHGDPLPTGFTSTDGRPLAVVTQGTLRHDGSELAEPAARALVADGFRVLVAGAATDEQEGPDLLRMRRVDLTDALARADLLVTNGGWTTVTLALAAGVGVVQCGATEEKPDIGARIRHAGVGRAIRLTRPPGRLVARVSRQVLHDPRRIGASARLARDFQALDSRKLAADAVLPLAAASAPATSTAATRQGTP